MFHVKVMRHNALGCGQGNATAMRGCSRGFGFVNFINVHSAKKAVSEMHGTYLAGKKLTVEVNEEGVVNNAPGNATLPRPPQGQNYTVDVHVQYKATAIALAYSQHILSAAVHPCANYLKFELHAGYGVDNRQGNQNGLPAQPGVFERMPNAFAAEQHRNQHGALRGAGAQAPQQLYKRTIKAESANNIQECEEELELPQPTLVCFYTQLLVLFATIEHSTVTESCLSTRQ
jgi:RNA recognition motif. (a.k.a. RRM, RBD, or RNP domain)